MEYNERNEQMNETAEEQETLGYSESAEADPRADHMPIVGFLQMDDGALQHLASEEAEALRLYDFYYVRDHARAEGRTVSYGELRLLNALVAARRAYRENYVISRLRIESPAVAKTYEDLLAKAATLELKGLSLRTVEDLASVSEKYMRRIGRGDDCAEDLQSTDAPLIPGSCFVLITPTEGEEDGYEEKLALLLKDPEVSTLCERVLRVGAYGMIGTLSALCDGVFADLRMIPHGEELSLLSLAEAHRGRAILSARRDAALWICRLAERFGLRASYFAKSTESGRFRTDRGVIPSVDWSIGFLRGLLSAKESVEAVLGAENPDLDVEIENAPIEKPLTGAQLARAVICTPDESYFLAAMHTAIAAVTEVVSRGIDRRRVGLLAEYRIPMTATEPTEVGADVATVLGFYRVAVELAAPQRPAEVGSVEEDRQLVCTAYTPDRGTVSLQLQRGGSGIYLLTYRCGADGVPDFASLRDMYDRFIRMHREGRIFSARAVNGDPFDVLDGMTRECSYARENDLDGDTCRGILIETDGGEGLPMLARVLEKDGSSGVVQH